MIPAGNSNLDNKTNGATLITHVIMKHPAVMSSKYIDIVIYQHTTPAIEATNVANIIERNVGINNVNSNIQKIVKHMSHK